MHGTAQGSPLDAGGPGSHDANAADVITGAITGDVTNSKATNILHNSSNNSDIPTDVIDNIHDTTTDNTDPTEEATEEATETVPAGDEEGKSKRSARKTMSVGEIKYLGSSKFPIVN